jgi:hypothetical protein
VKVTPTHLGRFNATAAIRFSSDLLDQILERTPDDQWRALADAYGVDREEWETAAKRNRLSRQLAWADYGVMRPLAAFNIRSSESDFIEEANAIMASLEDIYRAPTPAEKLSLFFSLFDTSHPEKLARMFLMLSSSNKVPRSVTFSTSASGKASKATKDAFNSINGKTFRSVVELEPPDRSRLPDEKLREFFPDEVKERRMRPMIKKIDLSMRPLPEEYFEKAKADPFFVPEQHRQSLNSQHVVMRLYVTNMSPAHAGKIYLRCEEAGKLDLGKFTLGEEVTSVSPLPAQDEKLGMLVYEFYLTGPLSPFQGSFFRNAVSVGGEFRLAIAASVEGRIWSDERAVQFVLSRGNLLPP